MRQWVLVCILLGASSCYSQDAPQAAITRLSNADLFAVGPVGYAGKTSEAEKDFRAIASSPAAMDKLHELYRTGNVQAKSYALLGIKELDIAEFKRLASTLHPTEQTVAVERGCIVSHLQFADLVKQIAAGKFDQQLK